MIVYSVIVGDQSDVLQGCRATCCWWRGVLLQIAFATINFVAQKSQEYKEENCACAKYDTNYDTVVHNRIAVGCHVMNRCFDII